MRVNRQIRADKVRVITDDGKQLGVMSSRQALERAESAGLDLVEIAPNATPPVCKIIDYSKFRYQLTKKEKEAKKSQHQVKIKEIKLKPNIDVHDLNTKIKRARDFIQKGFKVRITCSFRGRELLHTDLGERVVKKLYADLEDIMQIEAPMRQMGRMITSVIAPIGKDSKKRVIKKKETD